MLEWVVRMEYKFTITELTAGQAKNDAERSAQ
nr:MAG TPA: hypothetical protein [Caudoviricetes sp.]